MKRTLTYLLASISLIFSSCGGHSSIANDVAAAEVAIANDDVMTTRDLCDGIMSKSQKEGIDASQYARLSILYMQLNDRSDNPADIGYAARFYKLAYEIDADSAEAYYRALPVDQEKYVMTLSAIVHTLESPQEIPAEHDMEIPGSEIGHVEDTSIADSI